MMLVMPGLPGQVREELAALGAPAEISLRPTLGGTEVHLDGAPDWAPRLEELRRRLLQREQPRLVLRVADLARSCAFYAQLGWAVLASGATALTLGTPGGAVIMLALPGAAVPCRELAPGQTYSLLETGLAEARGRVQDAIEAEEVRTWGDRKLTLRDPDGYRVTLLEPKRLTDAQIIAIYLEGGRRVAALQALTEQQLDNARAEGKWTVRQIAHHLVTVELLSLGQLTAGIAEPDKVYRRHLWQPDDYARGLGNALRPIGTDLQLFDLTRRHVAGLLAHLPHAWDHAILRDNAPHTTVRNMVHQLATHTLHHLEQMPL